MQSFAFAPVNAIVAYRFSSGTDLYLPILKQNRYD